MTKKLAFASILTALAALCLCGSILLPTGRMVMLFMSSFCILVATIECNTRFSLLSYISTTLIGFLFMPFKLQLFLYAGILGYYPVVKMYIERINNRKLEWLVKVLFFSAILIIAYFMLRYFFMPRIDFGVLMDYVFAHLPVIVIAAEIIFIVYDYLLSMLATYYTSVIQRQMYQR